MEANPMPPPAWDDASIVVAVMAEVSKQGLLLAGPPEPSLVEEYIEIPLRDGHLSRTKIYRPAEHPAEGSPLIVYIYGGGWISGDCNQSTPMCREWVRLFGAVVVSVSYRLAPQHKWPTPWNDAWDSVAWIAERASELGEDPGRGFVVGDVSAGGSLSAFITAQSQTDKLAYPITGQWLSIPSLIDVNAVPEKYRAYVLSMVDNKDDPVLPASAIASLTRHVDWDSTSPMRYPSLHPPETLPNCRVPTCKPPGRILSATMR